MPYDRDVDDEYLALVEERNVFIVPTLGMVTKREPYRRPVFEDALSGRGTASQALVQDGPARDLGEPSGGQKGLPAC